MTPEQQANEWLVTVKDRAMTRAKAEAVAAGTHFSPAQLELVEIGILAGAPDRRRPALLSGAGGPFADHDASEGPRLPAMADPNKLRISERRLSPFGSEKSRDRADAQRQIAGLSQGASQADSLAYIAKGIYDLNVAAVQTNWLLEQILAATKGPTA